MAASCHYCGREYGDADGDAPEASALRRHLLVECTEVPAKIRNRYDGSCASGRCGF